MDDQSTHRAFKIVIYLIFSPVFFSVCFLHFAYNINSLKIDFTSAPFIYATSTVIHGNRITAVSAQTFVIVSMYTLMYAAYQIVKLTGKLSLKQSSIRFGTFTDELFRALPNNNFNPDVASYNMQQFIHVFPFVVSSEIAYRAFSRLILDFTIARI